MLALTHLAYHPAVIIAYANVIRRQARRLQDIHMDRSHLQNRRCRARYRAYLDLTGRSALRAKNRLIDFLAGVHA